MGKRESTRERLLDIAQAGILAKGFGATSIEEIIAEAEITKSGFFYHFKDKNELAKALIQRHIKTDDALLDDIFARARELNDDPLHSFLIGLKLLAEMLDAMEMVYPGCLVATFAYQERLFDEEVRALNREAVLGWRRRFRKIFEQIAAVYPPREAVDLDALADYVNTVVEGGIVMSRALGDPKVLVQQVMLLRSHVRMLFVSDARVATPRAVAIPLHVVSAG